MTPPAGCTLDGEDAASRLAEWRSFLARAVDRSERHSDQRLCLRLGPGEVDLLAAVDLSRREMACCDFFEFAIEMRRDANWLVVTVPAQAVGSLDGLAGLLSD